jgi:hypothetical protein
MRLGKYFEVSLAKKPLLYRILYWLFHFSPPFEFRDRRTDRIAIVSAQDVIHFATLPPLTKALLLDHPIDVWITKQQKE